MQKPALPFPRSSYTMGGYAAHAVLAARRLNAKFKAAMGRDASLEELQSFASADVP